MSFVLLLCFPCALLLSGLYFSSCGAWCLFDIVGYFQRRAYLAWHILVHLQFGEHTLWRLVTYYQIGNRKSICDHTHVSARYLVYFPHVSRTSSGRTVTPQRKDVSPTSASRNILLAEGTPVAWTRPYPAQIAPGLDPSLDVRAASLSP